jgi:hypothetical protein
VLNRLVMACGVSSTFEAVPGIDLRIFWRDALVAATAAAKLAPRLAADPEEAYVCDLLHATGHLILCRSYPEIADAMLTGFAPVRGAELTAIESRSTWPCTARLRWQCPSRTTSRCHRAWAPPPMRAELMRLC